jgi:2-aminoethylphosphonate-pyruvate transaminase
LTHVFGVHCETTSGILNPVEEIAKVVAAHGRQYVIDAMSSFGAIELDAGKTPFAAAVASSNKCLEGVPGVGFIIVRKDILAACEGNAPSLSLDFYDQWRAMEANAQWRFTPPVHCIAAFEQALREHEAEGGVAGRGRRYRRNCRVLVEGMRALGFATLLPDALQAPIIVTFHMPADPAFEFNAFYRKLHERGYIIYPGKLTVADSFRIGCIGRLGEAQMKAALEAIKTTLDEMGVRQCAPAVPDPAEA